MPDVFVSYARRDKPRVATVVARLRAAGLDIWWDDMILPNLPWERAIEQALTSARAVVVCWSTTAVDSENVRSEARWARDKGMLIQVFLDHAAPPLFFGERQGINLSAVRQDESGIARLIESLRTMLGDPTPAAAVMAASPLSRRVVVGGGVIIAAAAGGAWVWHREARLPGEASIAVMPFANLSGDPAQAYFSDGIAEEMRSALARLPGSR